MVVVREGVWVLLSVMRWGGVLVQQQFSFVIRSTAQFNLCIAAHSLRPSHRISSCLPCLPFSQGVTRKRPYRVYYLTFFYSHASSSHRDTHAYTTTGVYPHEHIPSQLHIPIIRQKGAGARAATVLFTPSLGRNWRLNGVYFETRGSDNAARYCSCCVSWDLYLFIYWIF